MVSARGNHVRRVNFRCRCVHVPIVSIRCRSVQILNDLVTTGTVANRLVVVLPNPVRIGGLVTLLGERAVVSSHKRHSTRASNGVVRHWW